MGKFQYESVSEDVFGHIVYKCKCSWCGADCETRRIIDTGALCEKCKTRRHNKETFRREQMKMLNRFVQAVYGYYETHDQMPTKGVFDELLESVVGEMNK